ncbi:MAG: TatD family hydrolase, partial [bacterium]
HLTMPEYQDINETLSRAKSAGLKFIIDVGFDIASSEKSTVLSADSDLIYTAVGIHPHEAKSFNEEHYRKIKELLGRPRVIAIGEIGLDYHYDLSSHEEQKRMFSKLLWTAREMKMPAIFHGRESYHDMADIVRSEGQGKVRGVFHSFAGGLDELKWVLDNGFYVSISGMITFKKAKNITDIAKTAPIDRILIETDCPYLSPEPYRGKRNEPSYVKYVAEALAQAKGISVEEVGKITTENAEKLFKI